MNWVGPVLGMLFCGFVSAQPAHIRSDNAYILSGAYSRDFLDAFSFKGNAACLAGIKNTMVGLLAERKWMLKELNSFSLSASFVAGGGGLGIDLQRSGDEYYHEQSVLLGYGKSLGRAELGVKCMYQATGSPGYGSTGFGYAGAALRYTVSENLIAGWELSLPAFGKAGKTYTEKGAGMFRMGLGYQPGPHLLLAIQVEKEYGLPAAVKGSVDYAYQDQLFFSFGINGPSGSVFFKSGWSKNKISILTYVVYENVLGFSPGLVLFLTLRTKKP